MLPSLGLCAACLSTVSGCGRASPEVVWGTVEVYLWMEKEQRKDNWWTRGRSWRYPPSLAQHHQVPQILAQGGKPFILSFVLELAHA